MLNKPAMDMVGVGPSRRSVLSGGVALAGSLALGDVLAACSSSARQPGRAGAGTVLHSWVGDPLADGFVVTSRTAGCTSVRLAVSADAGMSAPRFTPAQLPDTDGYVRHVVTGLPASSAYYYQLADTPIGGSEQLIGPVGRARTLHPPRAAVAEFRYAAGGALATNSIHSAALDDVRAWDPQLLVFLNNLHYHGSISTDPGVHRHFLEAQITGAAGLSALLREVPTVYDNGYSEAGVMNGDSDTPWERAFNAAYQQVVPARLVDQESPPVAKYRSWSEGRWGFFFVDTRSTNRSPGANPDTAGKTMLGAAQKASLKSWLVDGADAVKVMFCGVPWMGTPSLTRDGNDKWWAYATERQEIADLIAAHQVKAFFVHDALSRVAVDQTHNRWGGFPVVCGSPFDKSGGGNETNGTWDSEYNNDGRRCAQYLRLTFTDDGHTLSVTATGRDALSNTDRVAQTVTWSVA